jgi:hypothetical protein
MLISLCRFFHKLPSEVLKEDAEVIQLMKIYQLANPGEDGSYG